jgi:hypothetical protein
MIEAVKTKKESDEGEIVTVLLVSGEERTLPRREIQLMAKIIDWFPKIIFCAIPEIIMLMIPNAGIIKM